MKEKQTDKSPILIFDGWIVIIAVVRNLRPAKYELV